MAEQALARTPRDRVASFLWPALTLPGTVWLTLLFLVPVYAIMATAFGTELDFFGQPIPAWNPADWDFTVFRGVIDQSISGFYRAAWIRTFMYCAAALTICVVVGYPVAYYVARLAGRTRGLLLALILAPWWINYLTRMLAWTGLLDDEGLVNQSMGLVGIGPVNWLSGNWWVVIIALAYGYLPFFIIPLYAYLDRIDQRHIEASRDLGANTVRTFFRVTLPLSRVGLLTAIVITTLPMFGDYFTNTLVSNSPTTGMIGNAIETTILGGFSRAEGASLVILLSGFLLFFMGYYLLLTVRAAREA